MHMYICIHIYFIVKLFAGHRPALTWFLKTDSVQMSVCVCVCVRVCLFPRLLITSGVMWCDIDPI